MDTVAELRFRSRNVNDEGAARIRRHIQALAERTAAPTEGVAEYLTAVAESKAIEHLACRESIETDATLGAFQVFEYSLGISALCWDLTAAADQYQFRAIPV